MIGAEAFVRSAVRMAAAGGEIHPAVAHEIEHRRFFGELHRMMHRQSVNRDAKAKPLGSLCHRAEHDVGRGQKRELRLAVNLGDPISGESETIGQLGLLHKFFKPRRR